MLERGNGAIVNIGSIAGDIVVRPQKNVHYNASKAAVHHLTRSLAAEWAGRRAGYGSTPWPPGFIATPMNAYALERDVETTAGSALAGRGAPARVTGSLHRLRG